MALSVTVHGFTVKTGTQTTGRLATADITLQDGLDQVIYTVPETPDMSYAILAVSVCNRTASSIDNLNIAIADSDLSKPVDFIEWSSVIVPNGVLERTQLSLQPGQRLIMRWGTRPTELVPDHDIDDYAGEWTGAVTGTGAIDSSTAGQVTFTLAEGDTGSLLTNSVGALVDGETYRAAISFNSTDVTGVASELILNAIDTVEATVEPLITLGLEDRNAVDQYKTYQFDFTVDDAGTYKSTISELRLNLADVTANLDRISLIQIS